MKRGYIAKLEALIAEGKYTERDFYLGALKRESTAKKQWEALNMAECEKAAIEVRNLVYAARNRKPERTTMAEMFEAVNADESLDNSDINAEIKSLLNDDVLKEIKMTGDVTVMSYITSLGYSFEFIF